MYVTLRLSLAHRTWPLKLLNGAHAHHEGPKTYGHLVSRFANSQSDGSHRQLFSVEIRLGVPAAMDAQQLHIARL